MSSLMTIITCISLAGLLGISVFRFIKLKNNAHFIFQIILIVICFLSLYFLFYSQEIPITKGDVGNEISFIIVLYICMIAGMFAHHGFTHFKQPKKRRKEFDLGLFIAPIFASPIVFLPLLAVFQNAEVDLQNLTVTTIMVFFVAFENGFFWKEYFDNRRKEIGNEA